MMTIHCIACRQPAEIDRDPAHGGRMRDYCDPCRKKIAREGNNVRMRERYREARLAGAPSAQAAALARSSNEKFLAGLEALRSKP